ncbi:MAG: SH3 domain-containing protein [Ruminococcus sp.]
MTTEDADWIRTPHRCRDLPVPCDYFGIPLIEAGPVFRGTVVTDGSNLNLRQLSTQGAIIGTIPNGSVLTVYSRSNGWDVVSYQGMVGYASSEFITI